MIHPGFPIEDTNQRLFVSQIQNRKSDAFSPCDMTPDDVDYEMQRGKDRQILEICGMNQKSFEHFIRHYGQSYRYLSFFKCQLISDFSPLSELVNLEAVSIDWNIRASQLWDLSHNTSLKWLKIGGAKKITLNPVLLHTAAALETVIIWGDIFNKYPMESLRCFANMKTLKHLQLFQIKLNDHSTDVLSTLPALESFDFDAGMLTTEEIAWICAKHPALYGQSLCPYNKVDAVVNDVRICGYRKPSLDLPRQQKLLDKYVAQFQALVEQYRSQGVR